MPKSKIVRSPKMKATNQLLLKVKKPNQVMTTIGTQIQKKRWFKLVNLKNLLIQRVMRMTGQLTVTDNLCMFLKSS